MPDAAAASRVKSRSNTIIIIVRKYGQLGNRLFLYAHVIAAAEEHGLRLSNVAFYEYSHYFCGPSRDVFCRYPSRPSFLRATPRTGFFLYGIVKRILYFFVRALLGTTEVVRNRPTPLETISLAEHHKFDLSRADFVALAKRKDVWIDGYGFRAYDLFRIHADAIRRFLTPLPSHQVNVEKLIQGIRGHSDVVVGVHIRRGDYKAWANGVFYYDDAMYKATMAHVEQLFPGKRVTFLVCSNEEIDEATFAPLQLTPGTGHLVEDMYALAACDYILGPPSTFSAWASFYGDVPRYRMESAEHVPTLEDFQSFQDIAEFEI